jgi:outer membrane protein OmpA-like peptidoglycan-associated protein
MLVVRSREKDLSTVKSIIRRRVASNFVAVIATATSLASAGGLPLDRFEPAPSGDRMFGVPSPSVEGDRVLRSSLLLDYAHQPLVFYSTSKDENVGALVSYQMFLHLNASFALFNRLGFNADFPVALLQSGADPSIGGVRFNSPDHVQAGDLRLGARYGLFGGVHTPLQVSLGAYLWLPTAPTGQFVGDGKVRMMPQVIVGGTQGPFVWSFATGPQFRKGHTFGGVTTGTQWNTGAGFGYFLDKARRLQVGPEIYTAFTLVSKDASAKDTVNRAANIEILADVRYRFLENWEVGGGIGPGIGSGLGTPDFRTVVMLAYSPETKRTAPDRDHDYIVDEQDACPDLKGISQPDPKKNGCPLDSDDDGIVDDSDACPSLKGVAHVDPKKNGCPSDRDDDGIIDAIDACPDLKGISHVDPKKNGCPSDRDSDGIVDEKDACPDVKGVANVDPKKNGCPSDRDADQIIDENDACPNEKGNPDPDPKRNGCPIVHVTEQEIVILEQVQFDFNKAVIKKVSFPLLDKVAAVFKQYSEIKLVEVQGHTDSVGSPVHNRRLSQRRAEAVVEALVARGVLNAKVTAKGYGPDVPIGDNATEEGRTANRRVQFKIIEREGKAKR